MSSTSTPHRLSARFDRLPDLLAAAYSACVAAGMSDDVLRRVELVLEEAFANSIHHGYREESDHPVWFSALMLPDGLRLVYQDAAPPFDPLLETALPGEGQLGGVGRVLIKTLPRRAEYAWQDGRNTLILDFDLRG